MARLKPIKKQVQTKQNKRYAEGFYDGVIVGLDTICGILHYERGWSEEEVSALLVQGREKLTQPKEGG